MLTRQQQQLVAALGSHMAADALLDGLRGRETLQGGRTGSQPGCWVAYDRKGATLQGYPDVDPADRRVSQTMRPTVVVKVTWAEVAAHGASLPPTLRSELALLERAELAENRSWSEFSDRRGGYPHRRRFDSDAEHQAAAAEWDIASKRHIATLHEVWQRRKPLLEQALPLTVDDEPADLLELLDHQEAEPANPSSALQSASLTEPTRPTAAPHDGLDAQPSVEPGVAR